MFFIQLLNLLEINLLVVAIIDNNAPWMSLNSALLRMNLSIFTIIFLVYFALWINKDTLEIIFIDIWLCFICLSHSSTFFEIYTPFKLPILLTENKATIEVISAGLIF